MLYNGGCHSLEGFYPILKWDLLVALDVYSCCSFTLSVNFCLVYSIILCTCKMLRVKTFWNKLSQHLLINFNITKTQGGVRFHLCLLASCSWNTQRGISIGCMSPFVWIILLLFLSGLSPWKLAPVYCSTKHGIIAFTRSISNVSVNCQWLACIHVIAGIIVHIWVNIPQN